jgi:hypothetical protein
MITKIPKYLVFENETMNIYQEQENPESSYFPGNTFSGCSHGNSKSWVFLL